MNHFDTFSDRTQYESLERFAEFGKISACLIHEITNPLTAATINLQSLEAKRCEDARRAKDILDELNRYIDSARHQLQHHSQIQTFNVSDEMDTLALIFKPIAENHQVKLIIKCSPKITMRGDPVRFAHVVSNLVMNSVEAYRDQDKPIQNRIINICVRNSKKWVLVTVVDQAGGMKPKLINKIFRPFFTTKNGTIKGTGIGLSTVKQIVEDEFNGSIHVESFLNQGSLFRVRLNQNAIK